MSVNFIENEKNCEIIKNVDSENAAEVTYTNSLLNGKDAESSSHEFKIENNTFTTENNLDKMNENNERRQNDSDALKTVAELTDEGGDKLQDEEKINEWLDILGSGGILKKTIMEGTPQTQPSKGQKCTINYTCYLEDGTIVDSEEYFELFLGESDVRKIYCLTLVCIVCNVQIIFLVKHFYTIFK